MSRVTISYSLGALQSLAQLIDRNPKLFAKLAATEADRTYLRDGLGHAIRQMQYFRANAVAINTALAAVEAAEKAAEERVP